MSDLIDRQALLNEYDKAHVGPPGKARKLIADAPTASPWHRVEDGLPKYGQDVLAARLYGADSDGWAYEVIIAHVCEVRGTNYWNATNVTHWMPLPEPPKEEE